MKKKTAPPRFTMPSATTPAASTRPAPAFLSRHAIRESIESIVVAFILAFVFRSFEAEAFVIPTGSMAPTLMGAHKELSCPECGYPYQAGASGEADDLAQQQGRRAMSRDVIAVTCPLCRYTASVDPRTPEGREYPTYGGDRILVSKFALEFNDPRRWDVVVFKYPGEAQTNYIKRLVGLPDETVRLWHGDLYIKPRPDAPYRIERRDATKRRAMAQIVYDNDRVDDEMTEKHWPVRWQPWPANAEAVAGSWVSTDGSRSYSIEGTAANEQWLRYRHFVPSINDWDLLEQGPLPERYQPKPRLITDFYAYDTSVSRGDPIKQPQMLGLHWVGDLMLECQLDVTGPQGTATLELVKAGRHFRCVLDCQNGKARLAIDGVPDYNPTAQTAMRGTGSYHLVFANFDEQLTLEVNGTSVEFDNSTRYDPLANDRPKSDAQDPGDLAPAGIASQGAALRVAHLRLWRDIYYIAAQNGRLSDYLMPDGLVPGLSYDQLVEFWSTPEAWGPPGQVSPFDRRGESVFPLSADQFFVLGDNSPLSQDARLWPAERYVARELMVGKALVIFWPHSFNRLPGTKIPFPYFPNFARMGFIR